MYPTADLRGSRFQGLALALLLALLFMTGCIAWMFRDIEIVIGTSKIAVSNLWAQGHHSVLPVRLASFVAAVLFVHCATGLVAWILARLSAAALPVRVVPRAPWLLAGWMSVIVLLVLAANTTWYPASRFASEESWLRSEWHGLQPIAAMLALFGAAILTLTVLALRRAGRWRPFWLRSLAVAAAIATSVAVLPILDVARSHPGMASTQPNLVILGVDSLRNDLSEVTAGRQLTPNIDAFLGGAHRFRDAVSPLARTYPAWLSILTGRHPVSTNGRFNLMPRALVHEGDTLADALRAHGYRSVYATDESRFANFDESYGFDQLITPPVGASDFIIGTIGDLPLVNLLAGSRIGRWLFPALNANRAAYVTYEPAQFVGRLVDELDVTGPSFISIHLTLTHWPYSWAGHAMPTTPQEYRPCYRAAIEEVDRQFADVLRLLERKGVLENAIVVVLSDHGEALGFRSDSMLRETGTSREIWDSLWGHGTSVMSPHQYRVLLAMRAYGRARLPGEPTIHDWPVSLEDLRPTLEEIATGVEPPNVDGISLLPYLAGHRPESTLDNRVRYTETDFNTLQMMAGKINLSSIASESAIFYETAPETGWVQLRADRLDEIMARKQRAALSRDALLAEIPSWSGDSVSYLFSSRHSPLPRLLAGRPDPSMDPEAARLWEALQARFPGELPVASDLPRM